MLISLLLSSFLAVPAPAAPDPGIYIERWPEPVDWEVDPDWHDQLLEEAAGRSPAGARGVRLEAEGPDGVVRPLVDYLPAPPPVPPKAESPPPPGHWSMPSDHPGATPGSLSNKAVYVSQCHGWIWSSVLGRFATQRGNTHDTVEDFHNPEGANFYLINYLENAGASVYTTRERGWTSHEIIVDDHDPDYEELGGDFSDGAAGWGWQADWAYGINPFATGGTRRFPADGGSVVRWSPEIPKDGYYPIYVSWDAASDHATSAHYRITHPGGTLDRWYDQSNHGSTWQYVETLWLNAGNSLTIELIADGNEAGRYLSADAVRVGGGTGNVRRNGVITGRPRWEEGAILYTQYNGAPTSVYDPSGTGDGSDPSSRSRWAKWEHPSHEDAVYLSWHSNAANGTARGTVTYFAGGGADAPSSYPAQCASGAVTGSYSLTRAVQEELIGSFRALWDPDWRDRGISTACFAEVNPGHNDEMPATLVELAFHDNYDDALHLKHPRFRRDASRAMYRGIVRYFAERDGQTPIFLPEPPEELALVHDEEGLRLSWAPGPVGAPLGDAPTHYRVFRSADGRAWDAGEIVHGTSTLLDLPYGETVFVKVAAVNAGGTSFASEVVGARRSPTGSTPVLVVSAFDRLDRGLLHWVNPHSSLGSVVRMDLYAMNTYDIAAPHGRAIAEAGWYFDSVSDEAFETMDLEAYDLIVWAAGQDSTVDESFSSSQQHRIREFIEEGGSLWASGSEIFWDLDANGSPSDQAFALEVLGGVFVADAASSTRVSGEGTLDGVGPMDFSMEDGAPYPVPWPDVLDTDHEVIARYGDGTIAGYLGEQVAVFGFPFDTIGDPDVRVEVAARLLSALLPEHTPPEPDEQPDDETPGEPTGPEPPALSGQSPRVASPAPSCGCATPAPAAPWLLALIAGLALRRRRSRPATAAPTAP